MARLRIFFGQGLRVVTLVTQEGVQAQASDEAILTKICVLMADEGHQEQLSDAALLDLIILLAIQEGHQAQFSDSATLGYNAHAGVPIASWASRIGKHPTSRTHRLHPGMKGRRWNE
jgi:hypothetical protein